MASELRKQVERLAANRYAEHSKGGKITKKGRPSLLLDPIVAADVDLETIYRGAINGLMILQSMDPKFQNFENELFSIASKEIHRELLSRVENQAIDQSVDVFLHHLSPFLMKKCAHLVLEYLIRMYKVQVHNADQLLLCALPFHDSKVFGRLCQLCTLNDSWAWLKASQQSGSPPPRQAIVNRCCRDLSLLERIFQSAKAWGDLQTKGQEPKAFPQLWSFVAAVACETIGRSPRLTDGLLRALLPSVLAGLGAPHLPDFQMVAFMILTQLTSKGPISEAVLSPLLIKMTKWANKCNPEPMIVCLMTIVQTQQLTAFPPECGERLFLLPGFLDHLATLSLKSDTSQLYRYLFQNEIRKEDFDKTNLLSMIERTPMEVMLPFVCNLTKDVSNLLNSNLKDEQVSKGCQVLIAALAQRYPQQTEKGIISTVKKMQKQSSEEEASKGGTAALQAALAEAASGLKLGLAVSKEGETLTSPSALVAALDHANLQVRSQALSQLAVMVEHSPSDLPEQIGAALCRRLLEDCPDLLVCTLRADFRNIMIQHNNTVDLLNWSLEAAHKWTRAMDNDEWPFSKTTKVVGALLQLMGEALSTSDQMEDDVTPHIAQSIMEHLPSSHKTSRYTRSELKGKKAKKHLQAQLALVQSAINASKASGIPILSKLGEVKISEDKDLPQQIEKKMLKHLKSDPDTGVEFLLKITALPKISIDNNARWLIITLFDSLNNSKHGLSGKGGIALARLILEEVCSPNLQDEEKIIALMTNLIGSVASRIDQSELQLVAPNSIASDYDIALLLLGTSALLPTKMSHPVISSLMKEAFGLRPLVPLSILTTHCTNNPVLYFGDSKSKVQSGALVLFATFVKAYGEKIAAHKSEIGTVHTFLQDLFMVFPLILLTVSNSMKIVRETALFVLETISGLEYNGKEPLQEAQAMRNYFGLKKKEFVEIQLPSVGELQLFCRLLLQSTGEMSLDANYVRTWITALLADAQTANREGKKMTGSYGKGWKNAAPKLCRYLVSYTANLSRSNPLLGHHIFQLLGKEGCLNQWESTCAPFLSSLLDLDESKLLDKGYTQLLCLLTDVLLKGMREDPKFVAKNFKLFLSTLSSSPVQLRSLELISSDLCKDLTDDQNCKLFGYLISMNKTLPSESQGILHQSMKQVPITYAALESLIQKIMPKVTNEIQEYSWLTEMLNILEAFHLFDESWWNKDKGFPKVIVTSIFDVLRVLSNVEETEISGEVDFCQRMAIGVLAKIFSEASHSFSFSKEEEEVISKGAELLLEQIPQIPSTQTRNASIAMVAGLVAAGVSSSCTEKLILQVLGIMGKASSQGRHGFQCTRQILMRMLPLLRKTYSPGSSDAQKAVEAALPCLRTLLPQDRLQLTGCLVEGLGPGSLEVIGACHLAMGEEASFVHNLFLRCSHFHQIPALLTLLNCTERLIDALVADKGFTKGGAAAKQRGNLRVEVTTNSAELQGFYDLTLHTDGASVEYMANSALKFVVFCQDHLASPELHALLVRPTTKAVGHLQHGYLQLCEGLLGLLQDVATCTNDPELAVYQALWEALDKSLHSLLDTLQGLLTVPNFVAVVQELLKGDDERLQQSALGMFNRKMEEVGSVRSTNEEMTLFLEMLSDLEAAVAEAAENGLENAEHASRVQTALLSVDILARAFAQRSPSSFDQILMQVSHFVSKVQKTGKTIDSSFEAVISSGFLLLATLCALVGPRALPHLNVFLPPMMGAIEKKKIKPEGALVRTAALTALAAVAAHLPQFLHPFLGQMLPALLVPGNSPASARSKEEEGTQRTLTLLALGVQPRLLLPAVFKTYGDIAKQGAEAVCTTFDFLGLVLASMDRSAVITHLDTLSQFYLLGMEFHADHYGEIQADVLEKVDCTIAKSAVAMVLKLNEDELKGFFLRCSEWRKLEGQESGPPARNYCRGSAFYCLVDTLADRLKSIFTHFFGYILSDLVEELQSTSEAQGESVSKKKKKSKTGNKRKHQSLQQLTEEDKQIQHSMRRLIVSALEKCFQHDRDGFIDKKRFELLMVPLVDQLDAVDIAGGEHAYKEYIETAVAPALSQLASCLGQDTLWKPMNHRILMKTRSETASVRLASLKTLEQCFLTVGEEYLILLPECLSYLSELLEDDDPEVESLCRNFLKYLEDLSGENIESYLS